MGNGHRIPRPRIAALALAACLAVAACTVAAPTPQIIYVTPPPTPIIIYVTPPPTPTPAVTPSPVVTPTPTPTATPTPSPTPSPTSPAAACTGTADNKAFFAKAAGAMNWTVYCAVLPSGWHITTGSYDNAPNGELEVDYRGPGTSVLNLHEGAYCVGCTWRSTMADGGPAAFGPVSAELWVDPAYPRETIVDANYGSAHEYMVHTIDLSQATIRAFSAAMIAVPR